MTEADSAEMTEADSAEMQRQTEAVIVEMRTDSRQWS